jgi:hypothetical protein
MLVNHRERDCSLTWINKRYLADERCREAGSDPAVDVKKTLGLVVPLFTQPGTPELTPTDVGC